MKKSRSFERGYTIVFRGGDSVKYSLILLIIVIPYLMSLYVRETIIVYLKSLVIYGVMFLSVLMTLRAMVFIQSYRGASARHYRYLVRRSRSLSTY